MNQQNSWKRTEEIEIDLAELLCRFCARWKQAVICAAVFALIFGGYGYFKNSGNIDADEIISTEDVVLEEAEQQKVTAAVELEQEIRGLEEYLDNSVLMQIDPYHKNRVAMLYSIEQTDYQNLQKIVGSYVNFAVNGGITDVLIKADSINWDIDKSYLSELITAYQRTYNMPYQIVIADTEESVPLSETLFCIEVTGKDEKMAEQLAMAVQSSLKKYWAAVADKAGSHKLILLSSEKSVIADSSLQVQQHDKRTLLTTSLNSLQAMTDAFSEKQLIVYKDIVGLDDGDGKEKPDESPAAGKNGFSKKYIFLGFAGGILLYGCLFACLYIVRDTVKSAEEMKRLYKFPVYGTLSLGNKTGMIQTLNRIRLSCIKKEITKLCVVTDFSCEAKEKECIESIAGELDKWGIYVSVAENACRDPGVWDSLTESGNVLLVCKTGMTTHRQIDEEMEFYLESGITVAGAVTLDF